ncbi:Pycsar system effector family protein [Streptomyces sp. NPDC058734]|uniref:Pycsar system effector family protein n=1 Tax=Streptomyces sp. NPDC058734 TaxID=3346615 RepID=UPI0036C709A2
MTATPQVNDPQLTPRADRNLDIAITHLTTDLSRCDSKAGLLLALSMATLAGTLSAALGTRPSGLTIAVGSVGAAALLLAVIVLLLAVRPVTGGPGDRPSWPYWAAQEPATIRIQMTEDWRADTVRALSGLAVRKFRQIRWAVDLITVGLTTLALAAVITAAA